MDEPRERFHSHARQRLETELAKLSQVANISWLYQDDVLILEFQDSRDRNRIEFTHPRAAAAFIHGYLEGFGDGYTTANSIQLTQED